jgi:hypothetical protein
MALHLWGFSEEGLYCALFNVFCVGNRAPSPEVVLGFGGIAPDIMDVVTDYRAVGYGRFVSDETSSTL